MMKYTRHQLAQCWRGPCLCGLGDLIARASVAIADRPKQQTPKQLLEMARELKSQAHALASIMYCKCGHPAVVHGDEGSGNCYVEVDRYEICSCDRFQQSQTKTTITSEES